MAFRSESNLTASELILLCKHEGYSYGDIIHDLKITRKNLRKKWIENIFSTIRQKLA